MTDKEKQLNDMRLIDANELIKHAVTVYQGNGVELEPIQVVPVAAIDNAETYNQVGQKMATAEGFITNPEWNKGELLDCNNCEDKALSYSMGFQDGYLLGGFQLTELRRWLTSQGYSEGTVDDKINEFTRFVEKIRGEEE